MTGGRFVAVGVNISRGRRERSQLLCWFYPGHVRLDITEGWEIFFFFWGGGSTPFCDMHRDMLDIGVQWNLGIANC